PPTTWQELTETAKVVQDGERKAGNDKIYGIVFQGRAYEGPTCNALEWVDSFGGGTIVDGQGKVTINNPKAIAAIKLAASWIKNIVPEGVLNYAEEEARGAFQSGNAVFMRNWPYAWALSQAPDSPTKGKVGVMALPKGGAEGKNNQVSSEFWNAVHEVLSGKSDAEASISKLEKNLNRISRNGKW